MRLLPRGSGDAEQRSDQGHEKDLILLNRLELLPLLIEPVNKSFEQAIFIGIILTENDEISEKQTWLANVYHHDTFLAPVTTWANLLWHKWFGQKSADYGIFASFQELKSAYIKNFDIESTLIYLDTVWHTFFYENLFISKHF